MQSKQVKAAVTLLLVFMALLSGGAARRESVTIDEVAHIGAGVSYLQKLDMRMNLEHPPLAKMIAAIPLVLRGVHADYSHVSWTFSGKGAQEFLGEWVFGHWLIMRWNNPISTVMWARVPMLLLTLLLGLVIYLFGSRLGGTWGGLLCLSAYVSMPAFLTFGPLVVTDVVITLFWVLAVWQLPEMWRSPSRGSVVRFGLILAGAFLSKFSSGLLFFVFLAVVLSLRCRGVAEQPSDKLERRKWRRRAWWNMLKATAWAALFVYVFYLVFSWGQPTDTFSMIPHFPSSLLLRRLLMPVLLYLGGLFLFAVSAGSRATYILGHSYSHGVWFYFPTLFVLKSPLAFLLLLLLAIGIAVLWKRRSTGQASALPPGAELNWRALWVSLVVFVAVCMVNRLDLSIRHFLIAIAQLILLLAPLPRMLQSLRDANWRGARAGIWATAGLGFASLATAILAYPNYMPFLNSFAMGRPGYLLVNDSNIDWNHALPEAEKFVQQRGLNTVLLDEYGFSEPAAYVPQSQLWSCQEPSASDGGQWAIVSAGSIADAHNCLWLLKHPQQIVTLAGGSMYAFQLPAVIPAAGSPDGPPLPQNYHYLAGMGFMGDPRAMFLNCIRDPNQLQPTMDRMMAIGAAQNQKKKK
jgi:4-amino-4-deoxy-L-arabinose transferase-like glycosyltransferase